MQAGWWIMALVVMNRYHKQKPTLDWAEQGEWSLGFALYLLLQLGFNLQCEQWRSTDQGWRWSLASKH